MILTVSFIFLMAFSLCLYYLVPSQFAWYVLLGASLLFYWQESRCLIWHLFLGVAVAYTSARLLLLFRSTAAKRAVMWGGVSILVAHLFIMKDLNFFVYVANAVSLVINGQTQFSLFSILAPIGISYYTLSLIGYVIDVYREDYPPEKNPLRVALFACYFPQLTSGPVTQFDAMRDQLFVRRIWDDQRFIYGLERMLWGYFKKMVVADRVAVVVRTIFGSNALGGPLVLLGTIAYTVQLYADFSGCMDIILGASECFGITLPENFNAPFFSKNISEFWRRWHITLGVWFRNYLFYPLLRTKVLIRWNKICRQHIRNKRLAKVIPTQTALFVLWLCLGLWHGGSFEYIVAAGVLPFVYLFAAELFGPTCRALGEKIGIKDGSSLQHLLGSLRTLLLMFGCWIFVCSRSVILGIRNIVSLFDFSLCIFPSISDWNVIDTMIIVVGALLILLVDRVNYKGGSVRDWLAKQKTLVRWGVLWAVCLSIMLWGEFGTSSFIYFQF